MKIVRKSMLALLLASCVPMTGQAAGIVSTVATASDDIVVSSNAEATVTATGRTDLIAGKYQKGFVVGTWKASVTSGTVAYKLNEAVNNDVSYGRFGNAVNSSDPSKKVAISLTFIEEGNPNLFNGWRRADKGITSLNGSINLDAAVDLTPGSYPVGIDVAAYAE